MRSINEVIIHCSDTYATMDTTAADIDRWHKAKGWDGIGYHYVIGRYGELETGRDIDVAGAHCQGHNENSIGICLIGGKGTDGKPEDNFTLEQKAAARKLVHALKTVFPKIDNVVGHNHYNKAKACPCFNANEIINDLNYKQ